MKKQQESIDILLIVPPYRLVPPFDNYKLIDPPRSLTILGTILKNSGFSVSILDMPILGIGYDEIPPTIRALNPKAVGIQNRSTYSFPIVEKVACRIKSEFPHIELFVGGTHVSMNPEESLRSCKDIDYIVVGEAEDRIVQIVESLVKGNREILSIQGMSFRNSDGTIQHNPPPEPNDNLGRVPLPDLDLIPIETYVKRKERYILDLSRGCVHKCPYCTSNLGPVGIRYRNSDNVMEEIMVAYNRGFRNFYFFDNIFTANKELVIDVCKKISAAKIDIKWPCMTVLTMVDRELLTYMKQAGCDLIAYGIETMNKKVLSDITKHQGELQKIKEIFKLNRECGIRPMAFVMYGLPNSTFEEELETIRFINMIKPDAVRAFCFKPFHGTHYYKNRDKFGINILNWDLNRWSILDEPTHETNELSLGEITEVRMLSEYLFRSGGRVSPGQKYRRRKNVQIFKTREGGLIYNPFVSEYTRKTDMYLNGIKLTPEYFEVLYRCDGYHNEDDMALILKKLFDHSEEKADALVKEILSAGIEKKLINEVPDVMNGVDYQITSEESGAMLSHFVG